MTSDHELRELSKPRVLRSVCALVLWMFDVQKQTIKQYNIELITAIKATRPTMKPEEYKSARRRIRNFHSVVGYFYLFIMRAGF